MARGPDGMRTRESSGSWRRWRERGQSSEIQPISHPQSRHRQTNTKKSPPSHGDIDVKAFFPFPMGFPVPFFSSPAAMVSSLGQAGELSDQGAFCFLGIPALGGWRLKQALFFVLRAPTSHHAGRRRLVAPEPQGTIELLLIVSRMTALGFRVNGVPLLCGGLLCSCARTARSLRHCAAEINVNRTAAQKSSLLQVSPQEVPSSPRDRHCP